MRRSFLLLVVLMVPVLGRAEVVNIDGVYYPRDPFLTHQEQVKIFEEIKKEWLEFHRKLQPKEPGIESKKEVVRVEPEPKVEEERPEFPGISVDAVLSSVDINGRLTKWVLVDGKLLQEGDDFNNITIEKIGDDWVVVRWMGQNKRIGVGENNGDVGEVESKKETFRDKEHDNKGNLEEEN